MEVDYYKTKFEHLGGPNYRIFVFHGGNWLSLVIQSAQTPEREGIIQFFSQNFRHFDIEVIVLTEQKKGSKSKA